MYNNNRDVRSIFFQAIWKPFPNHFKKKGNYRTNQKFLYKYGNLSLWSDRMSRKTLFNSIKKRTITVIGELVIDEIIQENTGTYKVVVGGSPLNIAINLHDLGLEDVRLFGTVGNDSYGTMILEKLKEREIDTSYISVQNCDTSIVRINQSVGTPNPTFERCSDKHIYLTDDLKQAIKDSSIVHFSYWPLSDIPARETIEQVIRLAKKHDTIIGFDPNFHENLVTEHSPTKSEIKEIIHQANIMKPSKDDSKRLFEKDLDNLELLNIYQTIGCDLTVLSLGKDGIIAKYKDEIIEVPTHATEVVDVTGAGDAFYSGMYASIIEGLGYKESLTIGSICSAYNLRNIGGISNLPHINVIKERM